MSDSRSHIQFALLADLVEQQRAPDAQVREHLATCAACARDLEWLTRVIGAMRADQTQAAPAEVVARAKRIFRAPTSAAARPSLRQRVAAALSFDSATMRPAFGMRSAGALERQLLFSAGPLDVELRLIPAASDWIVAGQILGAGGGRQVELRGPAGSATAGVNSLGEFRLPPVPAGRYALVVQLDDQDLDIPEIELGG